jgi:ABC-type lipoprotein export system ATPase subunit
VGIEIKEIEVRLGLPQRTLFKIKCLQINDGEKVLITGGSGRGKTTLLNIFGGLLLPDHGEIICGGTNISVLNEEERCRFRWDQISYIFQHFNLINHLSVRENIIIGLADKAQMDRADKWIDRMGLKSKQDQVVSQLSLGEQQRVAVVRAMAKESKYVFADEPTSSLDRDNAMLVAKSLQSLPDSTTLVIVSHDDRITQLFSRVIQFEEIIQ